LDNGSNKMEKDSINYHKTTNHKLIFIISSLMTFSFAFRLYLFPINSKLLSLSRECLTNKDYIQIHTNIKIHLFGEIIAEEEIT
jgi:hypothetical protein